MVHNLYSVRDEAAGMYGPVFQAVNDAVAIREVRRILEKVPEYDRDSFRLYKVAEFDDEFGKVEGECNCGEVSLTIPKFDQVEGRK